MQYRLLGSSGLRVSELCLGAMTFGTEWGWGGDKTTSRAIFDAYVAAGGNFIDTANIYTNGTSEQYVGEFEAAERERFVVATKFSLTMGAGNHRTNIVQSVEASLRRLNLDYIELYWLHAWDFTARPDEVLRALDDLVRQGKVLYLGVSNTPAWTVAQLNTIRSSAGADWNRCRIIYAALT